MNPAVDQVVDYWPLAVYLIGVAGVIAVMIGLSYVLGQRHAERATNEAYESGILITSSARLRFSAKFYLVSMFFVIFDLEAVFLFAWATAVPELGWPGFVEVVIFIGILVVALVYLWRSGGLDFGPQGRRTGRAKGV